MIFPNNKTLKVLFGLLLFGLVFPDPRLYAIPVSQTQSVEVLFQKVSHQNPWLIREPIRKVSPGIRISENRFFTMSLPNERPLYAELNLSGKPNSKLQLEKYDRSTGFTILKGDENYGLPTVTVRTDLADRHCKYGKREYIKISFSEQPLLAYKLDELQIRNGEVFLFQGKTLCGIIVGNYLIPTRYLEHFTKTPVRAHSVFAHPGMEFESSLNSSERSFYFPGNRKGVLVKTVFPGVGPSNQLLPGDAIYEINGRELRQFPDSQIHSGALDSILWKGKDFRPIGSTVRLKFYRNGLEREIQYPLQAFHDNGFLVPETHPFRTPPYAIVGGILFTELTAAYLKEFGEDYRKSSEKKLLYILESYQSKHHPHRERVVLLSRVLPVDGNQGYHQFQDLILEQVNGKNVSNLGHLKEILHHIEDEFIEFRFSGQKMIVFRRTELPQIHEQILRVYHLKTLDNLGEKN